MSLLSEVSALGYDGVRRVFGNLGYAFFDNGKYNINIFGVRKNTTTPNSFDDALCYAYRDEYYLPHLVVCEGTTEPGSPVLKNPSNKKGAAILVPGQYRSTWKIDIHGAGRAIEHEALCQRLKEVRVYRDNDRDNVLDKDARTIDTGFFGINIHRASKYSNLTEVGNYSAGCQVFRKVEDFNRFMQIVRKSASIYGNKFSYTLIDEKDFFG